ncbi:phage tail protein [Pseudorhizobium marinum]|uniref:phage tail protein n=1 Tax=Pseudorhizobium marinum TaxID=1496690 RepID=UPI00049831A6|nr:phage tail protein [Pseudorhizobium marinum]
MPFISAITAAVFGAGTIAAGIASAAIGIGLNFVVGKLQASRAKKDAKQAGGTQFDREYGENVSRKIACGYVGIAGHDVYVNTHGTSNKELQQVFALSDFPCDGLSRVWAGGNELPLTLESDVGYAQVFLVPSGDYAGVRFTFYRGTQTSADSALVTNANPSSRWSADHIGDGMCYVLATLTYDQERLNSFPEFFFEIRGARLYDPRKDTTAGGSGSHRWGDYSTYEFSENPVVMDYNYRRGFSWNGDMFCGMGMATEDLPIANYATAANICDEVEGGEARYRCSVLLDCDVDHGDNIDALMQACGGMVIDSVDGSWPLIGTAQPIVATFTDDDLITDEPVRYQRRRSMADLVNSVGGTYPEPSNMWSPAGYDTQTNASQVALDRRTRDLAINFATVPSKRQANQLASIYYNENRYEATADIVLRPYFQDIKVGDWVQWNSARYGDRVYIVQSRSISALTSDGPRNVSLSLQERDGAIYAGAGVVPPVIGVPNGEPVYLNELPDWTVAPVLSTGPDGRTYPAFRMSWSPFDDVSVTGIEFRWWPKTEPTNIFYKSSPPDVTLSFIQEGIVSERIYVFQHRLTAPGRVTGWSAEVEETSLDGGNGDLEVYLANLNQEVKDVFAQIFQTLGDTRPLLEQLLTNFQLDAVSTEVSRRRLEASFDRSTAYFEEQIAVAANELEAVAAQITEVYAAIDEGFAQGRIEFRAAANQAGVDARFAVALRGSTGDAFKESGFFLELYTVAGIQKSRFAVLADQFVVTDGTNSTLPMIFEGGVLKLQIANIGTVTAGLLQSPTGKMVINLGSGFISISD